MHMHVYTFETMDILYMYMITLTLIKGSFCSALPHHTQFELASATIQACIHALLQIECCKHANEN